MAEHLLSPLEAIGDRSVREVEPTSRLAPVAPGIEVDLQRLDQLLTHARVGEERTELLLDDVGGEVWVAQEEALDSELGHVVDDAVQADRPRDTQALL